MMLDLLMIACGAVLVLAALIVLTVCKPAERSMRAVCALLIGCWGGLVFSRAVHGGHDYQVIDVIGPLAIALWISQAVSRRGWRYMRRSTDWMELDEVQLAHRGNDVRRRP
jgi:hypothetical protein